MTGSTVLIAAPLNEPIQPIPATLNQDPARAEIGRRLFADPRLSGNGRVSCASCHDLKGKGGADGQPRSAGSSGELTKVNTPTVLNAALNFRQFWDGRADSLESQIDHVIRSAAEMGSSWEAVVKALSSDAGYTKSFASAYHDGITQANVRNALATFEARC